MTLDPNICSHAVTRRDHHNSASLPDDRRVAGGVLVTSPGGCVRLHYEEDALGLAELALPSCSTGSGGAPPASQTRTS
jgi:hypothetical protein